MADQYATKTVAARLLAPQLLLLVPMTEAIETVTDVHEARGYVTVTTAQGSRFQWPADSEVDVLA